LPDHFNRIGLFFASLKQKAIKAYMMKQN